MSSNHDNKGLLTPGVRTALWIVMAAAGLAVWAALLAGGADAPRAWRALLVNFLFWTPLAGGMVVWTAVVLVSRGRWHGALERVGMAGMGFCLPSLAALVALWIGSGAWSPWPRDNSLPQGLWLNPVFLFARDVAALLLFWIVALIHLRLRRRGAGKASGAWLIVTYGAVFSLLGMDLAMSLDPEWYSVLFPGYFFISGLFGGVIAWALISVWRRQATEDQRHDLGKLIFAFCMLTSYLMFAQLLIIWYENLPQETRFIVPRMNFGPWNLVSVALLAVVYLGPLAFLLTVWSKRTPWFLGTAAFVLMAGLWVERWWLVTPTFTPHAIAFGLTELSITVACAGLFGLGADLFLRRGEGNSSR